MEGKAPQSLLPIGRFAGLVGLSVSALRFYADLGVLVPAHIDPESNYRYYAPEQVSVGQQVAALRRLDVPLDELRVLLGADQAQANAILEGHEQRLYQRFQQQREMLRQVATLLDGARSRPAVPVTYRHWPAQTVLSLNGSACAEEFHGTYQKHLSTLKDQAHAAGVAVTGVDFGLYHTDEFLGGKMSVEICLPVNMPCLVSPPVRVVNLPASRVACALHTASWQTFSQTYAALYTALTQAGYRAGSSYTLSYEGGTELGFFLLSL